MSPISWNEDASLTKDHQRRPNFDLSAPFRIGEMSPVSAGHSANSGHQSRRNFPLSHGPAEAPICIECQALQLTFYDPNCVGCRSELVDRPNVGVPNILAILRQWVPQVQLSVEFLINEALRRGAHPDDRDSVTDMTLLMYAVKAGASGVGDPETANRVVKNLLSVGATLDLRCRWTQMSALHYAAFFDVGPIVTTLLMESKGIDVDSTCDEFENGTPLHIAAENLSLEATKALLGFGADVEATDDLARKPVECIPEENQMTSLAFSTDEAVEATARLKVLLTGGLDAYRKTFNQDEGGMSPIKFSVSGSRPSVSGRTVMRALGLKIGDRVLVGGVKLGTLLFCGITDFAPGIWAGVELDDPEGKHNGTVDDMAYFLCKPEHGVFVQPNKISKVGKHYRDPSSPSSGQTYALTHQTRPPMTKVNHGKVDISKVSSRLNEAMAEIAERSEIRVGDRVSVSGLVSDKKYVTACNGVVRFVGNVDFVEDDSKWYGVELDEPLGRHDGTVGGIRYFAANVDRGIFVTESKLTKISKGVQVITPRPPLIEDPPSEGTNFSFNFHTLSVSSNNISAQENNKPHQVPLRRTLSMQHREQTKVNSETPDTVLTLEDAKDCRTTPSGTASPVPSLTRSIRGHAQPSSSPGWKSVGAIQTNKFAMKRSPGKKFLEPGESVICIHNKEMGVVKFVGRTDFGPGIWLGIELRNPKGKHDGTVEGRRYFTCKSNHGIMIRPNRVSVHGINGDHLLKPECDYPF